MISGRLTYLATCSMKLVKMAYCHVSIFLNFDPIWMIRFFSPCVILVKILRYNFWPVIA